MVRLFIAIPVLPKIKYSIAELVAELKLNRRLPEEIRFVPEENWHFTLVFLGYQEESAVPLVEAALKKFTSTHPYDVKFDKLVYGPREFERSVKRPRMIWLTTKGETSKKLGEIKEVIETEIQKNGIKWQREFRLFAAHLTLARFLPTPLKNLPPIEKNIDWQYTAEEITLLKSNLKRTGAEYETLFSIGLLG